MRVQQLVRIQLKDKDTITLHGGSPSGRDEVHTVVTSWPGWKRNAGSSFLNDTPCSIYYARANPSAILAPLACKTLLVEWSEEARALAVDWGRRLTQAKAALARPDATGWLPGALPTERQPMAHQGAAVAAIRHLRHRVLLADEMGLGKTATALWSAWDRGATKLLVLCTVSIKHNWASEILETIGLHTITVLDGAAKKRATQLAEYLYAAKHLSAYPHALILNYDLLAHIEKSEPAFEDLLEFAKGAFHLYDESHYLKSRDSERYKVTAKLAPHANGMILLSGTPVTNYVNDLFTQVELLRPQTWSSYHNFCERYLDMRLVQHGKKRTQIPVRSKRETNLNAIVNTMQIRRMKADCLDLPPKIHTYPQLTMDVAMRTCYMAMKEEARIVIQTAIAEFGGEALIWDPRVRTGAGAAMMRCEQIAQGFIGGLDETIIERLGKQILVGAEKIEGRPNELIFPKFAKMVWLVEAIEAVIVQGGRPTIFSRFNGPLFWLHKKFPNSVILHGALASTAKEEAIRKFQDKEAAAFFCQIRMAQGFNLVTSQDALFLGRDWAPAVNMQAEDRLHRIGQAGTVNVQVPIVRGTVEVYLDRLLRGKDSDTSNALKASTLGECLAAL